MERLAAVAENLSHLKKDEEILKECASAHLREAARLICDGIRLDDLDSDFDGFRSRYRTACDQIDEACTIGAAERILLCTHITDTLCKNKPRELLLKKFCSADEPAKEPVICYLRNPIADLAYTEFTRTIPKAGVLYADSFQTVCENLIGGECDYAILPTVSGSDGPLTRFETMIASYGFAVSALATVTPNPDTAPDTFALLSRNVEIPVTTDPDSVLCLSFSVPASASVTEILLAAETNAFKAVRVGTQSLSGRKSLSVTLDITYGNIAAFLAYLALETDGFVINGVFVLK